MVYIYAVLDIRRVFLLSCSFPYSTCLSSISARRWTKKSSSFGSMSSKPGTGSTGFRSGGFFMLIQFVETRLERLDLIKVRSRLYAKLASLKFSHDYVECATPFEDEVCATRVSLID